MDPKKDSKGRPATKFMERHTQKTHPENRPDVDAQPLDSEYEQASFQLPKQEEEPKRPDPNWKSGKFTKGYDEDKSRT
jgi:hypothetical protein